MKLWTIFRFEFGYQVRRMATWLYMAVLLGFTFLMDLLTTPGDGVYPNNTFHITAITVIGGLIWLVMAAPIAGEAAARDVQARMHALTFTAPITRLHYLGGRFLAAFVLNALVLLALPFGVLLSFHLPGMEQGGLQPFSAIPYVNVYSLIALPSAFVATALQFSFAVLSRQVMASYMASLVLALCAQLIAIAAANLFGNWDLVKLLDPVGISGIVGNELQTWSPTEKNTRLIQLEGMFLLNRILWLGIAVGALGYICFRFRFAHPETSSWWSRFKQQSSSQPAISPEAITRKVTAIPVGQVKRSFGSITYFHQTFTIAWASFCKIARHPVGMTLVAVVSLISVVFSSKIMTQFGIPLLPTTQQVVSYLVTPVGNVGSPWVVMPLLLLYFAGELVWQERGAGLHDLADATPVPEWVLFSGKYLGLGFTIVSWMVLQLAAGIGMQLSGGYDKFELGLYLKTLFGLQLVDYLLFALLALVIHSVVHQKYIGYLVALLAFSFIAFPSTFGVEHPLLIFGADPGWWYTDMRGFGNTLGPWLWFKIYWLAWALVLAVAARLLWARGREQEWRYRLRTLKRRFQSATAWTALVGIGLVLTLGSFIFYNTNIRNEYQSSGDILAQKAAYEQRYSPYRNSPQPQLVATKLQVELYPDQQQVEIQATYTLVNQHAVPVDSIHLGSNSGIALSEVTFDRYAAAVLTDKKLGHYIYALVQALQPGDSLQLNFVVHYQQHGFGHTSANALVVEHGTSFTNYDLLPAIGYQRYRELQDAVLRKKYGLPDRPAIPSLFDQEARKRPLSTNQTTFEAIIGTTGDEVAIAPGRQLSAWNLGDRRYFHFKTDAPIGGEYAILSGRYAVRESSWNDVSIRLYNHPDHDQNIDRMLRSVEASLAHFTEQFGSYPFKHFTVVERAGNSGGATADASIIYYGEQFALLNPDVSPSGFDLPYYILAHEVAHQWWGMARLTPAHVEGAGVLVEGLAVYAGMQVLEKSYGQGHLRQYVDYLHEAYAMPRSLASASLLQANEDFLYYRKGGLALYALSRYVGQEKVNAALRTMLQRRESGEMPLPTTLDLYQELEQVTPDSLHYLLHDLFQKNTYWRLKAKQLAAVKTKTGDWQVTLKVQAQKVVVAASGQEREVPMQDWLEVGIYEEGKGLDQPLYLRQHRIRSGEQTILVTVPRKPMRGGIDPNHLMIDLRLDDNMKSLGD